MGQAKDDRRKGNREFPAVQEHPDTQEVVLLKGSPFLSLDNKEQNKECSPMGQSKNELDGPSGQRGALNPGSTCLSSQTTSLPPFLAHVGLSIQGVQERKHS